MGRSSVEEGGEALGVPLVRQALLGVAGVRWIASSLGDESGERRAALLRHPFVDIDTGRDLVDVVDVPAHVLQHGADVRGADERGGGPLQAVSPPGGEGRVAAHRVLELGAVGLDGEARAARGTDRPAEQDVVAEDEVGRKVTDERTGIGLDPAVELVGAAVLHELDLVPLVAVEHEHGQQPADVRPDDRGSAEVVQLRPRLLAEDGDVVPGARPLTRELARVHVGARAAEQVAVPEQDAHGLHPARANGRHRKGAVA